MAAAKKAPAKKATSKKAPAKKSAAKTSSAKAANNKKDQAMAGEAKRFWSYILFFFGVAELLLTFVRGDGLWQDMFYANRGLFGMSVFLVGPLIIYTALQIASDKTRSAIVARAIQGLVLMILLSATAQILFGSPIVGEGFGNKLDKLYRDGSDLNGGGITAALIGWPLLSVFKKVGAAIIVLLLDFTFIMLLTDITLPGLFKGLSKPIVGGYKAVAENHAEMAMQREERREREAAEEPPARTTKEKKRVDIAKYLRETFNEAEVEEPLKKGRKGKKPEPSEPAPVDDKNEEEQERILRQIIAEAVSTSTTPDPEPEKPAPEEAPAEEFPEEPKGEQVVPELGRSQVWDLPEKGEQKPKKLLRKPQQKLSAAEEQREVFVDSEGQTSLTEQYETIPTYVYPPVDILKYIKNSASPDEVQNEITTKSQTLARTLEDFGIQATLVGISRGPSVTRYEIQPGRGVPVSKIEKRAKDIALNLAVDGVRIAQIPGKAAIGIEVPNVYRDAVSLRELIDSDDYRSAKGKLSFAVGRDIDGNIVMGDIATMPHMLIAGTTGSGKSVFTNSVILNILYHATPDEVKLILIDPKKVEFPVYNGIPHLLIPVVTDPMKAAGALGWAVNEMMRRYNLFEANGVKNIEDFNEFVDENPELNYKKLHYIVIIIDEFADLMLAAKNEVEESVMRLAQLARAAGMHMLIATQSPRTDVITGLIKANIPSRTALSVSSNVDSRVILDEIGAEELLGKGDLLYKPISYPKPVRIQSGYATPAEIRSVAKFLKNELVTDYDAEVVHEVEKNQRELEQSKSKNTTSVDDIAVNPDDDLVNQAITIIVETGNASTAYLQRKLKLGFPRAARIMDDIEAMGIIGPQEGSKPRKINITKEEWYERQGRS